MQETTTVSQSNADNWHCKLPSNSDMADKLKKGTLVRVAREKLENSLEALASDTRFPAYLFESKGEIVEVNEEYALIKFYVPTPNIWLRVDQLDIVK